MKPRVASFLIRGLILFCGLVAATTMSYAQKNGRQANGTYQVLVNSRPQGAFVELMGQYNFVGQTPFIIPYGLVGKFKVKARKPGYEDVNSTVNLVRSGQSEITIYLSEKTRFNAAYRSALLPGLGQLYGQSKLKALLMGVGQTTLGVITVFAARDYGNEKDDYERALARFNAVRNNRDEAEAAFQEVEKEFGEADDALGFRNTMIALSVGFWLYNVVDAVLFFSQDKSSNDIMTRTENAKPGITANIGQDRFMLTMQVGF